MGLLHRFLPTGAHHLGSADLTAANHSVVYPARPGVVVRAGFLQGANYKVDLRHEGPNGDRYYTSYVHLAEQPLVEVGDVVNLNTPLGYVVSPQDVHFTDGERATDQRPVRLDETERAGDRYVAHDVVR